MYLYFMYVLLRKDPTEFNGLDSYIFEKMVTDDVSWIPLKNSLSLKKLETEKDDMEDKFKLIGEELEQIEATYARLLSRIYT